MAWRLAELKDLAPDWVDNLLKIVIVVYATELVDNQVMVHFVAGMLAYQSFCDNCCLVKVFL